ncbi:hypothetical protein EJ05DRAFT_172674 [Pseudovirgaria hyperparasitica]|uniref:Uncharacterized protein n=1 Tax=Pseudovirgaria hyperparasitica TaxID=470096 RepID=A0A6A6VX47_9PEZI|nr:uncharacterized protein EJ05DRAFT_172674 [Pseudovirgaria hyperparasitica]KAF2753821.1 hypothetical protein EJ05DRAFT_172674 [Pseudovirgaria hyperparasitica]
MEFVPKTPVQHATNELPLTPPVTPSGPYGIELENDVASNDSSSELSSIDQELLALADEVVDLTDDEFLTYSEDATEMAEDLESECESNHDADLYISVPYVHTALLPAGGPLNFPHIVDHTTGFTEENAPQGIRLPDGVATLLFNFNRNILELFLDLSVKEFNFVRTENHDFLYDLVVARKDRDVRVGFVRTIPLPFQGHVTNMLEWDAQIRAKILPSGVWLAKYATRYAISDEVFGDYEGDDIGYGTEQLVQASKVHEIARQMATSMIVRKLWVASEGVEIKVNLS